MNRSMLLCSTFISFACCVARISRRFKNNIWKEIIMPTWPTKLYVDKQQPVFSSALVVWGLARLIHDLLEQLDLEAQVILSNQGACFCVATSVNFDISEVSYVRLLRQIRTAKQVTGLTDDAY